MIITVLSSMGRWFLYLLVVDFIGAAVWIIFCEWKAAQVKRRDALIFKKVEEFRRDIDRVAEKG